MVHLFLHVIKQRSIPYAFVNGLPHFLLGFEVRKYFHVRANLKVLIVYPLPHPYAFCAVLQTSEDFDFNPELKHLLGLDSMNEVQEHMACVLIY